MNIMISISTALGRLSRAWTVKLAAPLSVCFAMLIASPVHAAVNAPVWSISGTATPTHFAPGDQTGADTFQVTATNVGGAPTDGPITISATLPDGITFNTDGPLNPNFGPAATAYLYGSSFAYEPCDAVGQTVSCTFPESAVPNDFINLVISVDNSLTGPQTLMTTAAISGGGAPAASARMRTTISSTTADFDFLPDQDGLNVSALNSDGSAATQAGAHPYSLSVDFNLTSHLDAAVGLQATEDPKGVTVDLPAGVVVNPAATPTRCTELQLETHACPDSSAVGLAVAKGSLFGGPGDLASPIYNMVPPEGVPAQLGFEPDGKSVFEHINGGVRSNGDYGLSATVDPILRFPAVYGAVVTLWGDPSDPSHDRLRGRCATGFGLGDRCPVERAPTPLLTMPSACSGPLTTTASAHSWINPGRTVSTTSQTRNLTGDPVGVTGCDLLQFDPAVSVKPDVATTDSPTGLEVDIRVPQSNSQTTLATANLKDAVVTLPAGMSVSPSAADGLSACSPEQIALSAKTAPSCPEASKIGTVEIVTPLLDESLKGAVYVATQNDNPSRSVLGLYVTAQGSGVVVKLAGRVHADPATGRLTARFDDNPQLPFSDFKLSFFGGPRAALATPDACGTYRATSVLSPWSGTPAVTRDSDFPISSGCGGGFAPAFTAGVLNPSAGASSTFTLKVSRADGQQHIRSVSTTLPAGILANVGSVALCADADAAAGTCGAGSQVGSTDVAAGPGANPFHVAGKVFLTGPYKGAPYGLSIVTRAIAGPFDLGTVVVRAAISVDPIDAHVTVVSDDVPDILDVKGGDGQTEGFPLRVRSIAVDMDRPGFMVNPTSCDPTSITGTLGSWAGSTAAVASRFQIGNCSALDVAPKLAINLTGKGQTTDDKHPGVAATLTQKAGQANLKKVVVTLPLSLALDPDNAQALCEFTDGSKVDPTCPKASIVGTATATTPILNGPLTGPVYFVKNIRTDAKSGRQIRTLPKLVIPLKGPNGLRLNLTGTSNVVDNRLVTTFDQLPDAPVSDFKLNIDGGKHGILVVSGTDICKSTQIADRQVDGQNGKSADASFALATPACALKVLSKKVGKTTVAIKVAGLGAGKVTVTGQGIKKANKNIVSSTVATITAKRTKGKPGKVTVSFDPAGPAKARKTTK